MKNKKLNRFRLIIGTMTLAGLVVPFILQQSIYPFFRFGMFAEPVKRTIQMERFNLYGIQNGKLKHDVHLQAGINKSNIDYLLRNYYYRNEAQLFLQKIHLTLSPTQPFDSLIITRYFADDSTVVARFPQSE